MLPLLGAAALGGGLAGIGNFIKGQDEEKRQKKEAMRGLYNRMLSGGNMMQFGPEIQEGPGLGEAVGMGVLGAGMGSLGRKEDPKEEWYQQVARGYLGGGGSLG